LRGIPLWLLREYLQELGGAAAEDGSVSGPGWLARLEQAEDFRIGPLGIGQVRLQIEASAESWQALRPALEKKLLRAGG
jgi:hypothetical protein